MRSVMKRICRSLAVIAVLIFTGCGQKKTKDPITVTLWHVYGGQTESPLNDLIDEFNETIGKEEDIRVQVGSVTNTNMIHENVLASAFGDPGASKLPDMFVSYPKTVLAMPDDTELVDYYDYFTEEELKHCINSAYDSKFDTEVVYASKAFLCTAMAQLVNRNNISMDVVSGGELYTAIKAKFPTMFIVTDLCFCEYTDHGHCGILDPKTQSVDNDKTLEISAQQALVHARAGADMIAPSGMMDGIITTLRNALDENGFKNLPIMAYSTKFASGYYGPFRDVAESTPSFGDRRTYQMNPANRLEAIEESLEDEKEGADILMVKPALAFLDVVRDIRNASNLPLCVYNVSGEYAMLKHAGIAGLIDYERVMMETMIAFKRAGANIIISYHAKEVCEILRKQH